MDVKNNSKTSVDPPRGHYSNGGPAKVDNFDPEKASDEARKRLRQGESIDSDETNSSSCDEVVLRRRPSGSSGNLSSPRRAAPNRVHPPRVLLDRPAFVQKSLHRRMGFRERGQAPGGGPRVLSRLWAGGLKWFREADPWAAAFSMFPIIHWLPQYRWRKDFVADVSAGFTVAVMHIPQGMAYGILASVDPVVGIYTAFFPVMIYVLMGTSKHVSIGTFAVVSILVSNAVHQYAHEDQGRRHIVGVREEGASMTLNDTLPALRSHTPIEVATALAFMAGIFQVIFFMLNLGMFCSLLSTSLIRGFTTGAAVHVFSSQVKYLLGLRVKSYVGPLALFKMYEELLAHLPETNWVTAGISVSIFAILEFYSRLVEVKLTRLLQGISFPIHLLIVILGILFSHFLHLGDHHAVEVVGVVQSGLPSPTMPPADLLAQVAVDAMVIAVVSYVVTYSLATLFAHKHKYKVDTSQELLANGMCNLLAAFFSSLPVSTSLSRTLVQDNAGCKTLMTSAVSVFLLLWVLLFAGPLFKPLPNAVLSALIVHSLKGMFNQFCDLPSLWETSVIDLGVWFFTFLATVVLGVDLGLLVGVGLNLVILVYWSVCPRLEVLGETDFADIHLCVDHYHEARESGKYVIVGVVGSLNFANASRTTQALQDLVEKAQKEDDASKLRYFLLDLSGVSLIDLSACVGLSLLQKNILQRKMKLVIVGANGKLWELLETCRAFDHLQRHRCFPTIQDAVAILESRERKGARRLV